MSRNGAPVRDELVARQLDEQLAALFGADAGDAAGSGDATGPAAPRVLRVLDAGLGNGAQALRLARAGHRVTGLEQDPALRALAAEALRAEPEEIRARVSIVAGGGQDTGAHFLPGAFDVVLCHGVLLEARDPGSTLAGLARVLAPGGLLSLLLRNDAALAMYPGRTGDWDAALAAFDFPDRAYRLEALTALLGGIGTPLRQWYGVGVFGREPEEPGDGRVLAAEERAGRTDPYRAVASMLHLCAVRD
ncbi:class I SAM-dependent methyltransferase [Streptomyces sp. Z26]|uniref:class I SAM-dependent methyltransferase n=1 Tax=Streptomyces sp. Z26 TaxID=2500177 RepID=UPI000EF168ED|nr:class I SAM-dependent methyltransferase [Streptomyces sp. Z26]RLL70198.1 class I SAM-dependent methyltransferase [Streptomyces sp. Z26]